MQKSLPRSTALISKEPAVFAREIAHFVEQTVPTLGDIRSLGDQLLVRHAVLRGLKPVVSEEEIVESFFRCQVIDYVQRQFGIAASDAPRCVSASHRATRLTCSAPAAHSHHSVLDSEWQSGWVDLQRRHPEVNIRATPSARARHADLHIVVQNTIVSFEFKHVGQSGLNPTECAAQANRYIAAGHAASILVVYSNAHAGHKAALERLRGLLVDEIQLACSTGPAISPRTADPHCRKEPLACIAADGTKSDEEFWKAVFKRAGDDSLDDAPGVAEGEASTIDALNKLPKS